MYLICNDITCFYGGEIQKIDKFGNQDNINQIND